ncbi:MAG: septum formation inhibitor Maf [Epsilonproteobacteria bacterium]|nr:septum formation inhibitor Maf [Campylobacterota bacterium]
MAVGLGFRAAAVDPMGNVIDEYAMSLYNTVHIKEAIWLIERFGCSDYPLLVADTVVTAQGKILRKAKDETDAREMLSIQSGAETDIVTCMIYKTPRRELIDISITRYFFNPFEPKDIERYIQSGNWCGKAGACMVEGFCKPYIREVRGFESTAMGLSIEVLKPFLEE